MSERPGGDGDLDVDAAWAEIVARWDVDGDDVRVVRAGEAPEHPAPAATDRAADQPVEDTADDTADAEADDGVVDAAVDARDASDDEAPAAGTGATDLPIATPTDDAARPGRDDLSPAAAPAPRPAPRARRRGDAPEDDPLLAALDEHFVPADPPPLGGGDPLTTLAWLGALGGPVFLLIAALAWRTAPSILIGAAVLAFVAGFVTLVVRMPDRDEDDDGAEV